jgi:AraC family transcriptional regulator of adaptative response/methylated-DNA-[protein]-cysteine methyltransferase
LTPRQYAEAARLGAVKRQLRGQTDITGAMLDAGYASSSRFYERAVPRLGMTPSAYKQGGRGMSIAYTTVSSPLGPVLVAATPRGVCAVEIGSSNAELEAALTREYPHAQLRRDRTGLLSAATEQVVAHLNGREPRLAIPLDIRATAFQWRVWNALADIPYGETRTYGQIAAAIGAPRASRGVARACAANRAALAIPCHRVVPAQGGTGGYRWGASRKRALLALEKGRRET